MKPVVNGWMKFKLERQGLVEKEALMAAILTNRAEARAHRIAQRKETALERAMHKKAERAAALLARQNAVRESRVIERQLKRAQAEEHEAETNAIREQEIAEGVRRLKAAQERIKAAQERLTEVVTGKPKPGPVIPQEWLVLQATGALPGMVAAEPIHLPEPDISYADELEDRYILHLPKDFLLRVPDEYLDRSLENISKNCI